MNETRADALTDIFTQDKGPDAAAGISEIRRMSDICDAVKGINLAQGVCDLPVPEAVVRGVTEALTHGENQYTSSRGTLRFRKAVQSKLKRELGLAYDSEREIIITAGATGALYCALSATLSPGDEVVVFTPHYGYHVHTLDALGIRPVYVKMKAPDWEWSDRDFAAALTSKTKAVIINSPSNPCGKVWSRSEMDRIAEFALKHDLLIYSDEIYEYFIYDSVPHISPACHPKLKDRTIIVSGHSKTFSVTGWRIGFAAARESIARKIADVNDLIYICAPSPLQAGVAAGIESLPQSFFEGLKHQYRAKRDLLCGALTAAGLTPIVPRGAYYTIADTTRAPGKTSFEKAIWLLEKTGVACVPGSAFLPKGERGTDDASWARFCFAKPEATLREACARLKQAQEQLS